MDQSPVQSMDPPLAVDTDWSTAPNTPLQSINDLQEIGIVSGKSETSGGKSASYAQAMKDSDWYWEWHNSDEADFEREISTNLTSEEYTRAQSIDVEPEMTQNSFKEVNGKEESKEVTDARPSSLFCLPTGGLMSSSYPPVSLNCTPSTSTLQPQLNTTDPNDLPGNTPGGRTRENDVITTPPQGGRSRSSSSSSLKPRSIQEMSRLMTDYVPSTEVRINPKSPSKLNHDEDEDSLRPFCLPYSSRGPVDDKGEKELNTSNNEDDDADVLNEVRYCPSPCLVVLSVVCALLPSFAVCE